MDVWESLAQDLSNAWPGLDTDRRDRAFDLLRKDICRMDSASISGSVYARLLQRADARLQEILRADLIVKLKGRVFQSVRDNVEAYAHAALGLHSLDRKKVTENLMGYLSTIGYNLSLKDYTRRKKISEAVREIARSNEGEAETTAAFDRTERLKSRMQLAGLLANHRRVVELIVQNAMAGRKAGAKSIADACGCSPQAVYNLKAVTFLRLQVAEFILDHSDDESDDPHCKNAFEYAFGKKAWTKEYLPALRHIVALARAIKSQKRSPDDSETGATALASYSHRLVCDKCGEPEAWQESGCGAIEPLAATRKASQPWVRAAEACEPNREIHNVKCAWWYLKAFSAGSGPGNSMYPNEALAILKQPPDLEKPLRDLSICWTNQYRAARGADGAVSPRSEIEKSSP